MAKRTCEVVDCGKPVVGYVWCRKHYSRHWRAGTLPKRPTPYERFVRFVDSSAGPDGCHPWLGTRTAGYGMFHADGKMHIAPRWLLGHLRGKPLGPDEQANHHCDNPPCCNPAHLYIGDQSQNMYDAVDRGRHQATRKTHCIHGHEFTDANTYIKPNGTRACVECKRRANREYARRKSRGISARAGSDRRA